MMQTGKGEAPKRKRARKRQPQEECADAPEKRPVSDALIEATYRWLDRHEVPRLFAAVAREIGYTAARPRDFYCGCGPHFAKGVPACEGAREACPFAGRLTPEEIAANETGGARRSVARRIERIRNARFERAGRSGYPRARKSQGRAS